MALGTVIVTALGCLMFLDENHVASSGSLSAIAILLVILNIAFLTLVALAVVKQGRRYFWTLLMKAQAFSKAALRLVKAAVWFVGAPFVRKGQQPCLQLTRHPPNTATHVTATRSGSLQPMLSGMMLSQPNSSFGSWSVESPSH